ncbi:taste receptor type 2 member 1 [Dasypus novemcinctus]|uniref:taste receptor type 2 member 1 n=1 Tax=Dasypus novemcinctus TaxID=9361 RepID=UPI00265FCBD0|nr:taste receptor type 2 member 1 [Dasypus novemcinctus]
MLDSRCIILPCAVIQFLFGIFANGIIVIVNGAALIKNRKMSPLDLLLFCLAISRIGVQWTIFYANLCFLSLIELSAFAEIFLLLVFINESGLWLATWLGVFYCVKITNIAHPFVFWLKRKISKLMPWLILGSLLYSLTTSVFHHKHTWYLFKKIWLNYLSINATSQIEEIPAPQYGFLIFELLLPLLIFLTALLLLIFTLVRHATQMRNTVAGARDPSMSVHFSALLSILSFLILYLLHYMMSALFSAGFFKVSDLGFLFYVSVLSAYPSGHSVILILGNPKLKQNAKKFLLHSECCQ